MSSRIFIPTKQRLQKGFRECGWWLKQMQLSSFAQCVTLLRLPLSVSPSESFHQLTRLRCKTSRLFLSGWGTCLVWKGGGGCSFLHWLHGYDNTWERQSNSWTSHYGACWSCHLSIWQSEGLGGSLSLCWCYIPPFKVWGLPKRVERNMLNTKNSIKPTFCLVPLSLHASLVHCTFPRWDCFFSGPQIHWQPLSGSSQDIYDFPA